MSIEKRIARLEKRVAELECGPAQPNNMVNLVPRKPIMYLPEGIDHLDYLELRENIYEWLRCRNVSIWNAEHVLECLKYDLTDQACSGLKARE